MAQKSNRSKAKKNSNPGKATDLQVNFAQLPDACRPLVKKYGTPMTILYGNMSALIFGCGVNWYSSDGIDYKGLIVSRCDDDRSYGEAVADAELLVEKLATQEKAPSTIILSACPVDQNAWNRGDLWWVRQIICDDKLGWIAVTETEAVTTEMELEELFEYGDEVYEYRWLDEVEGRVVTLANF
jgi:hypothetical protein